MSPKLAVLIALLALLSPGFSHAGTIQDPIAHYIVSDGFPEDMKFLKWDHIDRVELDLNRDGKKVVFLATTYIRHGGMAWTVYVPGKHGYTVGLKTPQEKEMLCFSADHSYVGYISEIKHRGIVFFQGRVIDGFSYIAFWVENGKARIKEIGGIKGQDVENTTLPDPLRRKYFPELPALEQKPPFTIERLSMDELRARGYAIPKVEP